ncbi:MAG: hypothetical protein NTW87_16665 [Planctomycetota bacterium]|nr:hypothetical protein [Planctomycetota bacterium]
MAGKRNKVYHKRDCPYAANLDSPAGYSTVQDAESSGHIPCVFCSPRGNEAQEKTP